MPSRSVAALFALLVLLSVTVTGAAQVPQATGLSGENAPASLGATPATQLEGDGPPKTKMVIHVQPNGDARWSVTTTFELETDSDVEAFERLATEFEDGETTQLGLAAFERASEQASTATGRPMEIANVHRDARRVNDTGRLVLAFTWTNFAKQRGERLIVRDAFETPNGTWLPSLAPGQTLVIRPPPGYGVDSSPPSASRTGPSAGAGDDVRFGRPVGHLPRVEADDRDDHHTGAHGAVLQRPSRVGNRSRRRRRRARSRSVRAQRRGSGRSGPER
ncbi:hypothetical protein VB773_05560 [Haloarculaceae archaeon H-GB2-1]|nr:hypothetical protein [Haloarculaceae archaeon H-GB11]MEA5407096.1 hypothetical protein [Haloarculaceae archaeon H-GB2-1]